MRVCVMRKWPLRGRSRFVCWNITRVILWLLCNVHFVQSENWVSVQAEIKWTPINRWRWRWTGSGPVFCIVRRNQRELQLRNCRCRKQQCGGFCVSVWSFLVINVCNYGEHYETPCILFHFKVFFKVYSFYKILGPFSGNVHLCLWESYIDVYMTVQKYVRIEIVL
jgi:hypothetical protein